MYISKNIEEYPEDKIAVIFNIWGHYLAVSNEKQFLYDGDKTDFEICRRCWNKIHKNKVNSAKKALENHLELCGKNECKREIFPEERKNILEFKKFEAIVSHPFSISFDFESILKKINRKKKETTYMEEHIPISFGLNIDRFDGKNSYISHTGTNSPKVFVKKLEEIVRDWYKETKYPKKLKDVEKAKEEFEKATHCWACGGTFEEKGKYSKRKDHNHYTGEFRGIAHNCCNLQMRRPRFIPIYAHNLSGYDSKLFFDELVGDGKEKISVIPKTNEKFISFSKHIKVGEKRNKKGELVPITFEMRFIDFLKFQKASLDKLVKSIDNDSAFVNLRREFPEEEKFNLVKNKLIFPYSFIDSTQKLKEKLPPFKEEFWFNKLKNSMPDEEDYKRVVKIMEVFKLTTMQELMELYVKVDTLLLADVKEFFRKTSREQYGLDPAFFYTLPGLSWNSLFKKCKEDGFPGIELFTEKTGDIFRLIESNIRGGIVFCSHRRVWANNKYMKNYDPEKPSNFLKVLDINGLYGGIEQEGNLPIGGYELITAEECKDWESFLEKEGKGVSLLVDLDYPRELHDLHNEFPLAPYRDEEGKLVLTLENRRKVLYDYRLLKFWLEHGLILKKIHCGVKFNEGKWMRSYSLFNNKLREKAKNALEKNFYKAMNNLPYGKSIENVRNYSNSIIGTDKNFKTLVKTNFQIG